MTCQKIDIGLMTHLVTYITESAHNSAIAPTSILTCRLQDELVKNILTLREARNACETPWRPRNDQRSLLVAGQPPGRLFVSYQFNP